MSRRKRLGQNFLVDERITLDIRDLLADEPPAIFEIGPGRGALTTVLLERFDRVLALEVDERLVPSLQTMFRSPGFEVRLGDALDADFTVLLEGSPAWQVAANLPYSVGTAILRRLLRLHPLVTRLVVMLQKEVAERVTAEPGERPHGLLALERAARGRARAAFDVPPEAFRPRPKVDSTVLVIDLEPAAAPEDLLARALHLAGHALTRPRKVLRNAIRPLAESDDLERAGLDADLRPGAIDLGQWLDLARLLGPRELPRDPVR